MARAPAFWWREPGLRSAALALPALLYRTAADRRLRAGATAQAAIPVLCVGNPTVGGAGKTPTALALAEAALALGLRPGFLTRGHGGTAGRGAPHLVADGRDGAALIGDEPLLLAALAPTVVARDRGAGAATLRAEGCDLAIMDDGFQSARLHPDLALLVVDAHRALGNRRVLPAGPLRASLDLQLERASALLVAGEGEGTRAVEALGELAGRPVYRARSLAPNGEAFRGLRCLAFSGIADGEKFARALRGAGAEIVAEQRFPDHHPYTGEDARSLLQEADSLGLALVTTAKDRARMTGAGPGPVRGLAMRALVLEHRLEIGEDGARRLVDETLRRFQARPRS
ncbi:tetraacyldisaccharide 4'-kinase [Aureimonas sp. AU4]|uniref:tetraacyldisaccharide 4'-kinase n=1 Tax=Aureimonas sp. AU4 TaxID=1638163 RepID=UPI000780BAE2|nr:tetraacyldisaccharide 4'-kinase [Aureimonas sp. AU4]